MLVTILKNLSGLGKSFQTRQVVDLPDDVGAEWCRIGYATPATPAAKEKASSKVIPEVREHGNKGQNSGSGTTDNRTSDTARGKKPSKD
jgi:hypothetical protein